MPSVSSRSTPTWFPMAFVQHSLVTLVFITIAAMGASAQIDRAVLEGTVTDPSGAVIRGANVQVLEVNTGVKREQPCGPQKVGSISRGDLLQPIFVVQPAEHLLNSHPTIRR